MLKKTLYLILVLALAISLGACGNSGLEDPVVEDTRFYEIINDSSTRADIYELFGAPDSSNDNKETYYGIKLFSFENGLMDVDYNGQMLSRLYWFTNFENDGETAEDYEEELSEIFEYLNNRFGSYRIVETTDRPSTIYIWKAADGTQYAIHIYHGENYFDFQIW